MERPIITIPHGLLRHLNCDWDIDWRAQSAGESNAGITQIVSNAFPRWVGSPKIHLYNTAISQWQALRAQAQGRRGIYIVQMFDPVGFSAANPFPSGVPFDTGQPFSTGFGFEWDPVCTAEQDASAGATQIRVNTTGEGIAPNIGQIMSHNDWPFRVTWVLEVSTNVYDLGIQMPLRSAITAGDIIRYRGRGRFEAVEGGMGNASYEAARFSRPTLQFREVLTR